MPTLPAPPPAVAPACVPPNPPPGAGEATAHALLNCLVREVCGPAGHTAVRGGRLCLLLPATGVRLRVAVTRSGLLGDHRCAGPVQTAGPAGAPDGVPERWRDLDWREFGALVAAELTARTGVANPEFAGQLASSHAGMDIALAARHAAPRTPRPRGAADGYLASERALAYGHRFHPTPKARGADRRAWRAWAPETAAAFPLRLLAVRADRVAGERAAPGDAAALDRTGAGRGVPDGHVPLPVHPWQWELLRGTPRLTRALADGELVDLGEGGPSFAPTSSVRTLYGDGGFLKFSLNVRITNCLRKNARYELSGAVALTRLLGPVAADLAARYPGTVLLREPAYRSVALPGDDGSPDVDLLEGLGVIVRQGFAGLLRPGVTPLLAAALADPHPWGPARRVRAAATRTPAAALEWWGRYLRLLLPPVLRAFTRHGVVLEPHLQNVLIGVDGDGMPAQVLLRDLEGAKLVAGRHPGGPPPRGGGPAVWDERRGWDRVVYCLLVNHTAETLAALADGHPALEPVLWAAVRDVLREFVAQAEPGAGAGGGALPVAALLAGAPLPAKTNLLTRWARAADRAAGYVRLPSPLTAPVLPEPTR